MTTAELVGTLVGFVLFALLLVFIWAKSRYPDEEETRLLYVTETIPFEGAEHDLTRKTTVYSS
jgi:hypothetical protein